MLDAIYSGLGAVLKFFSNLLGGNFLVGLFVFAIIVKVVLLPFGIKQQKNSIRQSKMRPREAAIRKKYAGRNDRATMQKMNNEIMEMYQKEGYSPMGGCLPMVLQMVIIIFLYSVIMNPLQYVVGMNKQAVTAFQAFSYASVEEKGLGEAETLTKNNRYIHITLMKIMNEKSEEEGMDVLSSRFDDFCASVYSEEGYVVNNQTYHYRYEYKSSDGKSTAYTWNNVENGGAVTPFSQELIKAGNSGLSFNLFGIKNFLAETPSVNFTSWTNILLMLIPLLNFAAQFFTMKVTKKLTFQPMQSDQQQQMGCSPKIMDWVFPAITLVIAFRVPAAIGIYWLFNNFLGMGQTFILHKAMPLPVFTEEDYKEAERELKGKSEKLPRSADGIRSNPDSLHTIDFEEEDYAVLPDYESIYDKDPQEREQAKNEAAGKGASGGEPNKNIDAAPLKSAKKGNGKKKKK